MLENIYEVENPNRIITPSLIYYKDYIVSNINKALEMSGGGGRLWPQIKTHKMGEMIKLQQQMGINKFKCATIAEAEALVMCEAEDILIAYPLVGPNIDRFIELQKKATKSKLWAIGDDYEQLKLLSLKMAESGHKAKTLIDVNLGMNRTGCPVNQVEELYKECYSLDGLVLDGLHCYDGHNHDSDIAVRKQNVIDNIEIINRTKQSLEKEGYSCSTIIAGGTPSFPYFVEHSDFFVSPGTLFVSDYGYYKSFPDLDFIPGAAVITRVISHPNEDLFTLDLGYKGIAADPEGPRGIIAGLEKAASPLFQSEEHWVFKMNKGYEDKRPAIGTILYVIPTHICPTSALYSEVLVSENGKIKGTWEVTARNRKLSI
ncbi:MAG TPA: D-TA family PLP-dependent enzyme [Pseudobacteroides sp.]|nr:D-TA family PLP-dependent enzyme [Pseudobacteroides sp.]